MRRILLYVTALPTDVPAWLLVLLIRVFQGSVLYRRDGVLAVEIRPGSWLAKLYAGWGATTLSAHAMMFAPGYITSETIWEHELTHTEQSEAAGLLGALVALVAGLGGASWWAWGLCLLLPWANYGAAMLTALMRGEDAYKGNNLEEGAYDKVSAEEERRLRDIREGR